MCSDCDKQGTSRKAWSSKELVPLHVSCGGFLAFMRSLKDKIAPGEYSKHEQSLKDQFMVGALDPEIVHVLQTTVPPASLEAVSFLRLDVDYPFYVPSVFRLFALMLKEPFNKHEPPLNL